MGREELMRESFQQNFNTNEVDHDERETGHSLLADFMLPVDESMPAELEEAMEEYGIHAVITPVVRDSFEPTGPTLFTHTGAYKGVDSIVRIIKSGVIEEQNQAFRDGRRPRRLDELFNDVVLNRVHDSST